MHRRTRALFAVPGVIAAGVAPGVLIGSLSPLLARDFDFGSSEVGVAVGSFYLVCAVASTPAGHLAQRIGADRAIASAMAAVALSCLAVAGLADSAWSLILLIVLAGVGDALAGPACGLALQRELPAERHGVGFGALQAGAPLGALLAGLALPALGIPFGWEWGFIAAAVFAITAGLLMPRADGRERAGGREDEAPPVDDVQKRAVRRLALAAVLASAAGVSLVSFIVIEGVSKGIDESAAGLLLAAISLLAGITRVGAGVVADRRGGNPLPVGIALLSIGAAGYFALATGETALIVAGALVAGIGWSWPGVLTLAAAQRAPHAAGWAVGLMMSGLFGGALAGPLAVGFLLSADLSEVAWLGCAAVSLGAAAILLRTQVRRG